MINPSFLTINWYKVLFTIELIFAEFIFSNKLRRRNYFWFRLIPALLIILATSVFVPMPPPNPWLYSLVFLSIFLLTFLSMKLCFKESWRNILFCALAGYTIQHLSYLAYSLLYNAFSPEAFIYSIAPESPYFSEVNGEFVTNSISIIVYLLAYVNIYFFGYNTLAHQIKKNENLEIQNTIFVVLSMIMIISDIVLNMLSVFNNEGRSTSFFIQITSSIIICVLSLSLQWGALRKKQVELDYEYAQIAFKERLAQYEMSKENIDLINQKCHDLKHQIRRFRKEGNFNEEELKSIENAISIYESVTKTGNEALDTILTEKSLVCKKYGINLSMIINGELLSFIEDRDIFAFFGNALDNAIEALKDVDEEKRDITIIVKQQLGFITAHISNYFENEIIKENGEIKTSKAGEKGYHGFGIVSMKKTVERYGGTLSIETKNNYFSLNAVFQAEKR